MNIIIALLIIYVFYRMLKGLSSNKKPRQVSEIKVRFDMSGPSGYRSDFERHKRPNGEPSKWYESGKSVSVQGHEIPGGLVYVGGTLLDSRGYDNDACLINPKLKVTPAEPWESGNEMGYWPQYAHIQAKCRGAYLKWLAGGRSDTKANIGYVFLFFYGLERRLLVDGQNGKVSEKERSEIIEEVRRLLKIYGSNGSFRGYASNFLAMEWVLYQSSRPVPDYIDFNDRYCSGPFQVILAQYVAAGKPIPADAALQWITLHPEFSLRTPARRCVKEFRELFACRYTQKFGNGLLIAPNKTPLKLDYRAASPSIQQGLKLKLPDLPNPFILTGPLKKLHALAEECTNELEPYSRYLGRKGNDPKSLAALALLPKELMSQAPGAGKVKACIGQVCAGGPGLISVEALYASVGEKAPPQLGKKESESLAVLAEGLGVGMSPDMRFHGIKPSLDGKVVLFPHGHGVDFRPSKEFRKVCTILRLAAMVSHIDKDLSLAEEVTLQRLIQDNRELNSREKDSLLAFLHWCINTPQGAAGLKQRLTEMSEAEKIAISHILISVAYADGRIEPKEIKQLERLYTIMGLNKEQVMSDIHSLVIASEPVTVSLHDPETTFAIPKSPAGEGAANGFHLNEKLIRLREEETRQVKDVLEDIFSDQAEDEAAIFSTPGGNAPAGSPLASLDEAHLSLFHRLLTQETWERSALLEICKELGLMVDGAMEVLNEWAFDNANAPLIEDGEPVYVDINLAKEIIDA